MAAKKPAEKTTNLDLANAAAKAQRKARAVTATGKTALAKQMDMVAAAGNKPIKAVKPKASENYQRHLVSSVSELIAVLQQYNKRGMRPVLIGQIQIRNSRDRTVAIIDASL